MSSRIPTAVADEPPTVHGVVAVGGAATEHDRQIVSNAIAKAVTTAHWQLPASGQASPAVAPMLACSTPNEIWRCVPAQVDGQAIDQAVVVTLQPKQSAGGLPSISLAGRAIAPAQKTFVVRTRYCDPCTDDKLSQAAGELTDQLLNDLAARIGHAMLEVKTVPEGAFVSDEDGELGATNNTFPMRAGKHTIKIKKPGYLTETVAVQTEDHKTRTVSLELRHEPASLALPIGLVVGGAAIVVGGILITQDSKDGVDDKYRHSRATAVGVTVSAVGVLAIATGAYLWWRHSRSPARPETAPVVSPTPGGATLGIARSF
jgi:hypothetical protein